MNITKWIGCLMSVQFGQETKCRGVIRRIAETGAYYCVAGSKRSAEFREEDVTSVGGRTIHVWRMIDKYDALKHKHVGINYVGDLHMHTGELCSNGEIVTPSSGSHRGWARFEDVVSVDLDCAVIHVDDQLGLCEVLGDKFGFYGDVIKAIWAATRSDVGRVENLKSALVSLVRCDKDPIPMDLELCERYIDVYGKAKTADMMAIREMFIAAYLFKLSYGHPAVYTPLWQSAWTHVNMAKEWLQKEVTK